MCKRSSSYALQPVAYFWPNFHRVIQCSLGGAARKMVSSPPSQGGQSFSAQWNVGPRLANVKLQCRLLPRRHTGRRKARWPPACACWVSGLTSPLRVPRQGAEGRAQQGYWRDPARPDYDLQYHSSIRPSTRSWKLRGGCRGRNFLQTCANRLIWPWPCDDYSNSAPRTG